MIQGLYAAASGMLAVEERQAVLANNIANALTPGFKRQIAVQEGFYTAFRGAVEDGRRFNLIRAPGGGVKIAETFTDYSGGIVQYTGNPLDIALIGPGFFAVQTPQGEFFTRGGRLAVGVDGQLATPEGFLVLSADGAPIDVSGGTVEIQSDGSVLVDGETRGRIGLTEFEAPHRLARAGGSLLSAPAGEASGPAERTRIQSASLETSNVQVPVEMSHLMLALRAYAANQQAIQSIDETASRMINQVGAPS